MDISQEVFMKIYDSIDHFRGDSKITTWLYRIAVNKSLNHLRSVKKRNRFVSLDIIFGNDNKTNLPEDPELKPGENIELDESKKALYFALRKLSEKQNIAVSLSYFEDLPYKEISEIMNITVTEVGVLINRGKKKLHKIITEYYQKN
jgi:RNA polymerase sigma-70 factor (ECF subfamily)